MRASREQHCRAHVAQNTPTCSHAPSRNMNSMVQQAALTKEQALPRVSADTATTSQVSASNSGMRCCNGMSAAPCLFLNQCSQTGLVGMQVGRQEGQQSDKETPAERRQAR